MVVNIVNKSDFELPKYETVGSAGMDLRADLKRYWAEKGVENTSEKQQLILEPFQQYIIPTGIFIALPKGSPMYGYEAQIRPRSGLAAKFGITVVNSPGTIDSDYRGEIKVILMCLNKNGFTLNHGERIAQMVFKDYLKVQFEEVENLDETTRGEGGFGHTGTK